MKRQPTTPCYYPGSTQRKSSILATCPKDKCTIVEAASVSEETKVSEDDQVVVVECGTPGEGYNSKPLLEEAFGPVLGIVELDRRHNVLTRASAAGLATSSMGWKRKDGPPESLRQEYSR